MPMNDQPGAPRVLLPSILEVVSDPHLFPSLFDGGTWRAWRAFLAAVFGLRVSDAEAELIRRCTGRQKRPSCQAREAWVVVGRRGGKSRIAALLAVYLACFREYHTRLAQGERGIVMLIASDRRQARVLKSYVSGLLHAVPMLEPLIVNETAESIELENGIVIEVHTASFRAVRGYTVVAAILDEIAFWPTDDAANPDSEILTALRPAMATVPGALLVAISSPYARRGELWKAYRDHFGKEEDRVLVWQANTQTMNPSVPADVIQAAYADDPIRASAEYGAEFRRDIEAFISLEVLEAAIVAGRYELPPVPTVRYVGFVDPSGGSADSMTLALAHSENGRVVQDVLREVLAPFSPEAVAEEFAAILKAYGVSSVIGDHYGGEWPRERFRVHGISYDLCDRAKSDLYRDLLPLLNSKRLDLLDHKKMCGQFLHLERRTGRNGKDTIDHPPGAHDDLANATAGALVLALASRRVRTELWVPDLTMPGGEPPSPDLQQVFGRYGSIMEVPVERPFTCADCTHYQAATKFCTPKKMGTLATYSACEDAYGPKVAAAAP